MKVDVVRIEEEREESGTLFVHRVDRSVENLVRYMEEERFRKVLICGEKDGEHFQIDSDIICFIETSGDEEILKIHGIKDEYQVRARLYEMERLLPAVFVRVSRSAIVNLDHVVSYKPLLNGLMEARCSNEKSVYISRRYLRELRERLREEMER